MDSVDGEIAQELFGAHAHMWNNLNSFVDSISIKCAAQLGLFVIINNYGKPMALSELVAALPIHPNKTHYVSRLMHHLVHSGFITVYETPNHEQDGYLLTTAGSFILQLVPKELLGDLFTTNEVFTTPWKFLSTWVQNNDATAFHTAYSMSLFDYMARNPSVGNIFNKAMACDFELIVNVMLKDCREVFEGLEALVDVGGGTGTTAKAIADAFPNIKCIVLDLPHVVANLQGKENLHFIGGDMFAAIPHANAIFLKWILHNFNDEDSIKILKRCKEAIPSNDKGGKVIIIDMVINNDLKLDKQVIVKSQLCTDLTMMVLVDGKERTEKEWKTLFLAAGFSHYKITTKLGFRSLIEAYP